MKTKFFALLGIILILSPKPAFTEKFIRQFDSVAANYVVIGAFAYKKNALKFTLKANKQSDKVKLQAKFELNSNRNLYYVYVLITPDHEQAILEATRLRSQTEFADTWVYHGPFSKSNIEQKESNQSTTGVDIDPTTKQRIEKVTQGDTLETNMPDVSIENQDKSTTINTAETSKNINTVSENSVSEGKKFIFKLSKAIDNSTMDGEVEVIDAERSRKIGTYKGNVPVNITGSSSKIKRLTFICEVFGYRKVQRDLDYNTSKPQDITLGENHELVIPFELVRLQKGDIAVMYNVYFFKDAGVMRPESRFEVNSLYEMLKENPNYKILLHGHTNGGAAGKIISLDDTNKNFFSLSGTKESVGSAKKLSEERAKVIKDYLVSNGIDPARMTIKAWGGKRPIHDKLSNRAQENVRVEIEILED